MRPTRDNLIMMSVVAVVSLSYVLVVYRWQSKKMDMVRTDLAAVQRQLQDDTRQSARVPAMMREIESMKQRYNKDWDRRLPQQKELAGFLREIASNLAQEQLPNEIIQPGDPYRGELYNVLPISMTFEGDFLALSGFLRRVDEMTRLTRIEQLSIQPKKDDEAMSVVVGMNIYFTEQ